MREYIQGFAIFSSAIAIGLGMMLTTWKGGGVEYASQQEKFQAETRRDPAAIQKTFDFSDLEGEALSVASKRRLLGGARVVKSKDSFGFELGHFVMKGSEGQKSFACDQYDKVTVVFEAEGMAFNGEMPEMEISGGCDIAVDDVNRTSPLWVPYAQILSEVPREGEFQFGSESDIKVRFSKVLDAWPKRWNLKSIRMAKPEHNQEVWVSHEELMRFSKTPIVIDWSMQ